jgi:hypothetical protein
MIKQLFLSKKFLVMLSGIVVFVASRLSHALDPADVDRVLALIASYIVGQGIADHGKEAAKISAAAE